MAFTDIVYPNDEQNPFIVEVSETTPNTNSLSDICVGVSNSNDGLCEEIPKKFPIIGTNE